jgi:hypothetical protein
MSQKRMKMSRQIVHSMFPSYTTYSNPGLSSSEFPLAAPRV